MSFKRTIRFKSIVGIICLLGLWTLGPLHAQEAETAEPVEVVDTAAVAEATGDTEAAAGEETVTEASETVAAAPATTASAASAAADAEEEGIAPQVYKNFFYYVFLFVLICVFVAAIGRILHIYELTRTMNGRSNEYYFNNLNANFFLIALVVGLYGVYWSYVNHGSMAVREAATEHGQAIDIMFWVTTIIVTIVLVLTHIALFGFVYTYRARPNRKAYFYPHNNTIEKVWTIVPATVLTILVLFGFFTWRAITDVPEDEVERALKIEVVGEQFMWTVRYPGFDGTIGPRNYKLTTPINGMGIDFSDQSSWDDQMATEIVLPVNQPVRFQITSKDALHSFYIPDFRVQMNAVPGMNTYFQFTPTITTQEMRDKLDDHSYNFVMLCAKICGTNHFNMQRTVRVVSEEEYRAWLAEQPYFLTEDLRKEFKIGQVADEQAADAGLFASAN